MLVDGVFYEQCAEPTVVVFTTEVDVNETLDNGTFALVTTDPHLLMQVDKRAKIFQVENYDAALVRAHRANSSRYAKDILARANEAMAPEIDQNESIYAVDVAWMRGASRIALSIAGWLGGKTLRDISDDLFAAYSKIHKSLHMPDNDERFDLMSEGLTEIVKASCGADQKHLAKIASECLEILDERPLLLDVRNGTDPQAVGRLAS